MFIFSDPVRAALVIGLLVAISIVLLLVIWSIKRHRSPHLHIESDQPIEKLVGSLAGLCLGTPIAGNSVEIFENGALFDVMMADMAAAERSVHFETFLWKEGKLGTRVADALCERAREGVMVRVLLDATGTEKMGKETEQRLRESGCKVTKFHPRHLRNIGVINERDHRKIVVLDGRTAWVCGHCIVDCWLGNGQDRDHWRDIRRAAARTGGARRAGRVQRELGRGNRRPLRRRRRISRARARRRSPRACRARQARRLRACRKDPASCRDLLRQEAALDPEPLLPAGARGDRCVCKAVGRGVDVRVMVPSAEASDMPMVQHAAHRNFEKLLDCGVRIFENSRTLLHQKVMTVDGVWCAIGSTNFDDRAFEINDEVTIGFLDARLARELEVIFERDLKDCVELQRESWSRRGFFHTLKDHFFYLFNEQL